MPRNPGIPHYQRIADALLSASSSCGADRLPSERALARRHRVSRNTARRALEELRERGYVSRLQGSGTYRLGKSSRMIYGFGYLLDNPCFARFFEWMRHRLAEHDYRLIVTDIGLRGENIREYFHIAEVNRADAIFWIAPSHPEGLRAAVLARRKIPARMPLVLVNDPMCLLLQGPHRFDLVHYDYSQATRRLVERLFKTGRCFPVLVCRSDVRLFSIDEAKCGFISALGERGIKTVASHILKWDPENPATLRKFWRTRRGHSAPDAFILPYECEEEFRRALSQAALPLSANAQMIVFGSRDALWRSPMDFRDMAETCIDLLLSRFKRPTRANLRVALPLPVLQGFLRGG